MAIFLTLLYLLTAYLTPPVVFGPLGLYHVQVIIAVPTMILSLMKLQERGLLQMSQSSAAIFMIISAGMSFVFNGMIRDAPTACIELFTNIAAFFFVACNFHRKAHLKLLVAVLFFVASFVIVQSQLDERTADVMHTHGANNYYIFMLSDKGEKFFRIRGLGVIGDPNDFAQFLLALLPCLFFFWVKGKQFLNLILVYLPGTVCLIGVYLTHSRGALLAIAAESVFLFRKKIGLVPSAIAGGLMLGGLMATGFTGGRDVSASSGEDRMELWSTGLQLIRSHPIFGVGIYHFMDWAPNTAHNTVVVCAAETGVVGFFFWVTFMVATLRDANLVSTWGVEDKRKKKREAEESTVRYGARHAPAVVRPDLAFAGPKLAGTPASSSLLDHSLLDRSAGRSSTPLSRTGSASSTRLTQPPSDARVQPAEALRWQPAFVSDGASGKLSPDEVRRLASLILLSFVGLFVTGWFLSRAFAMLFFVYGGIAAVICRMAKDAGIEIPRLTFPQALKFSLAPTFILVAIVYTILRFNNLFR